MFLTFKKFISYRIEDKKTFINIQVIPTYKRLYNLCIAILLLFIFDLLLLFSGSYGLFITLPLSILLVIYASIWVIYNKYILKTDKISAFIFGVLFTIVIFAVAYDLLASYYDYTGGFNVNDKIQHIDNFFVWVYYSIVVFSTLGFGDITPLSTFAMFLTAIEIILHYLFTIIGLSLLLQRQENTEKIILDELQKYSSP